jgi:hypothetical protein
MDSLIGRSFDGKCRWKLLVDEMFIVILDTGVSRGNDYNLVGVSASDMRVKWVIGGAIDYPDQYDGIVNVWIRDAAFWASTWSGDAVRFDFRTGGILERVFRK